MSSNWSAGTGADEQSSNRSQHSSFSGRLRMLGQSASDKARELSRSTGSKSKEDDKPSIFRMEGMLNQASKMLHQAMGNSPTLNAVLGSTVPPHILRRAQGLAFLSIGKAGFVFAGEAGFGVAVCRLPDNAGWSPPAAFQIGGVSWGFQVGASVSDLLLVFMSCEKVKGLSRGQMKLGGDLQLTVGPVGRDAKVAGAAGTEGVSACYAYSYSKGLFGGVAVDGSVMWPHPTENKLFYGRDVKILDIFEGKVRRPQGCQELDQFEHLLAQIDRLPSHSERASVSIPSTHAAVPASSSSACQVVALK